MFHGQVCILLDLDVLLLHRLQLILDFGKGNRQKLVLPLLSLYLLLLVTLFLLKISNRRLNPVQFVAVLFLGSQQLVKLLSVPSQVLFHFDDAVVVIELVLLLSGFVLQQLQLFFHFDHVGLVS